MGFKFFVSLFYCKSCIFSRFCFNSRYKHKQQCWPVRWSNKTPWDGSIEAVQTDWTATLVIAPDGPRDRSLGKVLSLKKVCYKPKNQFFKKARGLRKLASRGLSKFYFGLLIPQSTTRWPRRTKNVQIERVAHTKDRQPSSDKLDAVVTFVWGIFGLLRSFGHLFVFFVHLSFSR